MDFSINNVCAHPHCPRPTQLSNPGYATAQYTHTVRVCPDARHLFNYLFRACALSLVHATAIVQFTERYGRSGNPYISILLFLHSSVSVCVWGFPQTQTHTQCTDWRPMRARYAIAGEGAALMIGCCWCRQYITSRHQASQSPNVNTPLHYHFDRRR